MNSVNSRKRCKKVSAIWKKELIWTALMGQDYNTPPADESIILTYDLLDFLRQRQQRYSQWASQWSLQLATN
ncbi:MAG: hypothetical protein KDE31_29360 [Caldilineaceae bacterium]|nr:hypothetical protein [Caldilineaceae bacterium]